MKTSALNTAGANKAGMGSRRARKGCRTHHKQIAIVMNPAVTCMMVEKWFRLDKSIGSNLQFGPWQKTTAQLS
jgi:hypothetical protein